MVTPQTHQLAVTEISTGGAESLVCSSVEAIFRFLRLTSHARKQSWWQIMAIGPALLPPRHRPRPGHRCHHTRGRYRRSSQFHTHQILRPLLHSVDMLVGVGELSGGGSSSLGPGYNESQWSAPAPGMQQPISQCVITQSNATVCTPALPV